APGQRRPVRPVAGLFVPCALPLCAPWGTSASSGTAARSAMVVICSSVAAWAIARSGFSSDIVVLHGCCLAGRLCPGGVHAHPTVRGPARRAEEVLSS